MTGLQLLLFGIFPVVGLAYYLWKTQIDWRRDGFGLQVIWGMAASPSAFFAVAFLFAGKVLSDLP